MSERREEYFDGTIPSEDIKDEAWGIHSDAESSAIKDGRENPTADDLKKASSAFGIRETTGGRERALKLTKRKEKEAEIIREIGPERYLLLKKKAGEYMLECIARLQEQRGIAAVDAQEIRERGDPEGWKAIMMKDTVLEEEFHRLLLEKLLGDPEIEQEFCTRRNLVEVGLDSILLEPEFFHPGIQVLKDEDRIPDDNDTLGQEPLN